jgi:hypothetical protein
MLELPCCYVLSVLYSNHKKRCDRHVVQPFNARVQAQVGLWWSIPRRHIRVITAGENSSSPWDWSGEQRFGRSTTHPRERATERFVA